MSKQLTTGVKNEIESEHFDACYLCDIEFDSGTVYLTDAGYNIPWNGNTYLGVGAAGNISASKETSTGEITSVKFTLAGPIAAFRALALAEDCNNRKAVVRLAVVKEGVVQDHPVIEFLGRLGTMSIVDEPDESTGDVKSSISVVAESRFASSRRPKIRRHAVQDHQLDWPGDTIHRFIPKIIDKAVPWPAAAYWRK